MFCCSTKFRIVNRILNNNIGCDVTIYRSFMFLPCKLNSLIFFFLLFLLSFCVVDKLYTCCVIIMRAGVICVCIVRHSRHLAKAKKYTRNKKKNLLSICKNDMNIDFGVTLLIARFSRFGRPHHFVQHFEMFHCPLIRREQCPSCVFILQWTRANITLIMFLLFLHFLFVLSFVCLDFVDAFSHALWFSLCSLNFQWVFPCSSFLFGWNFLLTLRMYNRRLVSSRGDLNFIAQFSISEEIPNIFKINERISKRWAHLLQWLSHWVFHHDVKDGEALWPFLH